MKTMLSIGEAMDAVDWYGPDADFWPTSKRHDMENMLQSDEEFADYVTDQRRIDEMLDSWQESSDGASINWDDVDFDAPASDGEPGDDGDDPLGGLAGGTSGAVGIQKRDEESDTPFTLHEEDVNDMKDMDAVFSNIILEYAGNLPSDEFRVFTRDYDKLVEFVGHEQADIEPISQAVAKSTGPLQKDLRRMIAARTQSKRTPGMRRGRLHAPNLHRVLTGDDRVFTRKEEATSLDTCITLLIDCSGSMSGQRLTLANQTAFAIASVLERINVPFECLGFTCDSQHEINKDKQYQRELIAADQIAPIARHMPISVPKFKAFEERFTTPIQRRFAAIHNRNGQTTGVGFRMGSTPEGCGIEFAARRLLKRKEKRKIMLVMTDGEPGGPLMNYNLHGIYRRQSEDMVKAVTASGIDIVGIGIMHAGPKRYYPNAIQVDDLEEMPRELLRVLKSLIV